MKTSTYGGSRSLGREVFAAAHTSSKAFIFQYLRYLPTSIHMWVKEYAEDVFTAAKYVITRSAEKIVVI